MELNERKRRILQAIIDEYIETAEPVGSRTIAKTNHLNLSAATIRNEMADLEDMGYLDKPHTSAGRVPSNLGYRFYVDSLMQKYRMTAGELETLQMAMRMKVRQMDRLIEQASRAVSHLTKYTAFATLPERREAQRLKSFNLLPLEAGMMLMIVVTEEGQVKNRTVHASGRLSDEYIKSLSVFLDHVLTGKTIGEIRLTEHPDLAAVCHENPGLILAIQDFLQEALGSDEHSHIILDGASNMFRYPEYKDIERAQRFYEFLDHEENLRAIAKISSNKPVVILIGDENRIQEMKDCGLVVSNYTTKNGLTGSIGVIGPVRMDYARASGALEAIAKGLEEIIGDI